MTFNEANDCVKRIINDIVYRIANSFGVMKINASLLPIFLLFGLFCFAQNIHIKSKSATPSLLPLPQQLQWNKGIFPLKSYTAIRINNTSLQKEAKQLQQQLSALGIKTTIEENSSKDKKVILLRLGKVTAPLYPEEAYQLIISQNKIELTANTPHGIFNGLQTLYQLINEDNAIQACTITDWPAYQWRGYMVDAGRNFQSMDLLKQQIEIMSRYKLNIFHFHITEDIAWRLAIKQYPQLTAPENMLRNKGKYYTEADMKELIAFCKERYITLIPEIDMPGHSAAFTRAFGFNMQSDSGLVIVKNILREVCATYDIPYLHIGGDEVKITNKNFLPEVIDLVHRLGKKTIGWSPGGNIGNETIRQLWMGDAVEDTTLPYIDSRHLYINHMDPLESVVTIFFRQMGSKTHGDSIVKGAILCLWPDRRVEHEDDVLKMNPAYPDMLTFAERIWRGGGYKGWIANINADDIQKRQQFQEFEHRLIVHKKRYFSQLPFPYVAQSQIEWKLFGPYDNGGDLSKTFAPENKNFGFNNRQPALKAVGGTIVLRHWWAPLIAGVLPQPKENTTWYATRKIWSDDDTVKNFWIGFNNLSRSPATDSPPVGAWDDKQSEIWVNGALILPPHWKRGGQKGDPEIPLVDEGYEYRSPTKITLHKGWNTVLIKAPVGSFKGKDWQNPVKWMFTFVEVK